MEQIEITGLDHVVLYKFQKMVNAQIDRPVLSFSKLWYVTSNAACKMGEQGIAHPLRAKHEFAREFFAAINELCNTGLCWKREELNGTRKQLISLGLTDAGREKITTILFTHQDRAQEPEVIWNPRNIYRGPII